MAWEHSNRKARLPKDWAARRQRVLRRDGYKCQHVDALGIKCEQVANQVDHIERGDNHNESNLQSLCRKHHAIKSSREGNEAHKRRQRKPEPHPYLSTD